jgi:hypothetical protein
MRQSAAPKTRKENAIIDGPMGEIDPLGTRKDGLDAFLDEKLVEGFTIETRTDTHAIIFRQPRGIRRLRSGDDPGRFVVEVDEDGNATMRPAEPRRS